MEVDVLRCMSQRTSDWRRAVPCKLNNVKMTFITLDNYNGLFKRKRKNSQRKFLSKFARQIDQKITILELRL